MFCWFNRCVLGGAKSGAVARDFLVVLLAALMVVVGFVPAQAVAPIGNSTFLAQTQTQNLSGINGATNGSYMAQSVVLNGVVYFIGNSPTTGPELYSTDGTAAGTNLVKDVYSGASGYANSLTLSNGKLFFSAQAASGGYEPYVSDGTAAGTMLLKDINPNNASSSPSQFTQGPNGLTYFLANDGTTSLSAGSTNVDNGAELWVTDGTTAGTRKVKDVNTYSYYVASNNTYNTSQSSIANLTNCNGKLFFTAAEGNYNSYTEIWTSDGTTAGTTLLKDINLNTTTITYPMYSQALGITLAAGATISLGSSPISLTCVGSTLYFAADDGTGTRKLYKSDGTSGGTVQVRAVASGSYPTSPSSLIAFGTKLLFSAYAGPYGPSNDTYGTEPWITDGTDAGTVLLKDINPNSANSNPTNFVLYNGQAYFSAFDSRGFELWKTDGTTVGTLFVKDINTTAASASSSPQYFYVWNNKLFFTANDGVIGQELYVTQGTGVSTVLVKDVFPGISDMLDVSNVSTNRPFFAGSSNALVFVANSPIYGQELWKTDGTTANTQLLQDLNTMPGSANAHDAIAFNGKIYFSAASAYYGQELWSTDLTTGNTQQVIDIYPGASSGMDATSSYFTIFNGRLYFSARNATSGYELFSTDGTAVGTSIVSDVYASSGTVSAPSYITACNGKLYWQQYGSGQYGTLYTIYSYDGTTVTQIFNNQLFATNLTCFNNQVYFTAQNYAASTYDYELWRTDGTRLGTSVFYDAYTGTCGSQGCSSSPSNLTVANGKLYFTAYNPTSGNELYFSDGTTTTLIDIYPGAGYSSAQYLRVYNGQLWFKATTASAGSDLMSHDGTTLTARDVVAGSASLSLDTNLVVSGGLLWYRSNTSAQGWELHSSDGTSANTGLFEDLTPGTASTTIAALTAIGGVIMYNTYDTVMGSQPRFIVVSATTSVTFDSNGATGGAAPTTITVMSASATIPGNTGAMVKTGYDFVGWNTSSTGIGTNYLPGSTITPVVDTPLYAKWASQTSYTITYNANGATSGVVAPPVTGVTSMIDLDTNSGALAKSGGYVFGGWNTLANGGGTNYAAGSRYTATANVTLYAKWTALASATITYNLNGATGTAPSAVVSYVTATVTLATQGSMVAPANKTFAGWNTNAAGSGSAYASGEVFSPQGSITLYAQWTGVASSTLTYDANGSTSGSVPASLSASGTYVVIDSNTGSLRKTGFIFSGWNTQADGTGTTYQGTDNLLLNANTTLYALWVAANYTVTFAGNSNTGGTVPAAITGISVSATVPDNTGNLVRAGYTFAGWNTLASGLGTTYLASSTITPTASTTLYAKWTALPTYTITYNGNGSTGGGVPVAQSGIYASVILDNNSGNLVKSGSFFAGWNTQADGLGTTFAAGSTYTPSANITLYALWSNIATYTLTYNSNSSTSGTAPLPQTGITSTATVSTNSGSVARLGYRFDGWNTLANAAGVTYAVGATITLTADTTLYAIWTSVPTYTITFNGNAQTSGSIPSAITSSDASVSLPANTGVLNKTNYTFNGWNTLADGTGTHYDVASAFALSANVTLYAEWLGNIYTLTYNANGSTAGSVPAATSGRGTLTTAINSGALAKDGYTFSGWNTVADGTGTSIAAGATYAPTANTTLFAKWTALPSYSVTFNGNGATSGSAPAPINGVYASTTLPGNTGVLALAARVFGGWNTLANATGTYYAAGSSFSPTANVTLYAVWNVNYAITYDANGATSGTVPATQTGLAGNATVSANTGSLALTGYNFAGWNTLANGTGTNYAAAATINSNADVTLYAKWVLVPTFSITYDDNGSNGGSAPMSASGVSASTVLDNNSGALTKTGFVFAGWNTQANGLGTTYAGGSSFTPTANVTLYALWTNSPAVQQSSAPRFAVTSVAKRQFDLQGGTQTITGRNLNVVNYISLDGERLTIISSTESSMTFAITSHEAGWATLVMQGDGAVLTFSNFVQFVSAKTITISNFFTKGISANTSSQIAKLALTMVRAREHKTVQLSFGDSLSGASQGATNITLKDNVTLLKLAMRLKQLFPKNVDVTVRLTGNTKDLTLTFNNN